jgi:hypothetical protein
MPPIMRMIIINKRRIQIGDNTHHHDHAITLVSLRPTKKNSEQFSEANAAGRRGRRR